MTVQLSSLRVSADLDVSGYVRAAAEKENADKKITASSREAGQALAAQDALAQKVGAGVASLSRQYIEGYAQAAKFEQAVRQVGAAMDRGMDAGRAAVILDGVYRKFGQVADGAKLAESGYVSLAPVVAQVNAQFERTSALQDRLSRGGPQMNGAPAAAMERNARASQAALTNLSFQINDLATQIASGSSPLQAIAQQGGQIFQIWQQTPSVFGDAGRALGGIVTPARLAGGAIAGAALAGVAAYERWQGVIRDTSRALLGTGLEAGTTREALLAMADAAARAQGGSAANARGTLNALANTGRIAPGMLTSIASTQRDLAATLGVDAAEANKLLASSFADPVRGAEELNKAIGGLGRTTQDYIRQLVQQGREQEAQQVLLDRIRDRIGKADELTSFWARSWEAVTSAASGAADAIGRALDRQINGRGGTRGNVMAGEDRANEDRLRALEGTRSALENLMRGADRQTETYRGWVQQLQAVNAEMAALSVRQATLATSNPAMGIVDPVIAARGRRNAFEAARNNRLIDAGVTASREMGAPDTQAAERVDRLIGQYQTLLTARRAFEAQGGVSRSFNTEAEAQAHIAERYRQRLQIDRDLATARRAIRDEAPGASFARDGDVDRESALRSVLTLTQQINEEGRVQRLEQTATTAAQREQAAAERARLELRRQGVQAGGDDARQAALTNATLSVRTQIEQQLTVAARQRLQSANENIAVGRAELDTIGRSAEMQERNRLITSMTTDALRERKILYGDLAQLPEAEAAAIRRVASEQAAINQQLRERRAVQDIEFERSQMFRSPVEQQVASRTRGIYGDDYMNQMNGFIAMQERLNGHMRTFGQIGENAFSGIADALMNSTNRGEALQNVLRSTAAQLIQMSAQSLWRSFAPSLFSAFGMGGGGGAFSFGAGGYTGMGPFLPSAMGNVFSGGNVVPFANGGIVSRPTYFPMVGGKTGLMGEAGDEAIMPLKRLPSGKLGVHAEGGGGASVVTVQPQVTINNNTPSQVQTRTDSNGNLIVDIMDATAARSANRAVAGRGPMAGMVDPRMAAQQRFG